MILSLQGKNNAFRVTSLLDIYVENVMVKSLQRNKGFEKYLKMYSSTVTEYLHFVNLPSLQTPPSEWKPFVFFLLFSHCSRWLAGVSPGDSLQSVTLQNNYVYLKGATAVRVSKIR